MLSLRTVGAVTGTGRCFHYEYSMLSLGPVDVVIMNSHVVTGTGRCCHYE